MICHFSLLRNFYKNSRKNSQPHRVSPMGLAVFMGFSRVSYQVLFSETTNHLKISHMCHRCGFCGCVPPYSVCLHRQCRRLQKYRRAGRWGRSPHTSPRAANDSVILSRLVDTFISRISLTMLPVPKPHNTACVLSWEEARRWQSRSSGYSSS